MGKTCFDCGKKLGWSDTNTEGKKLREFQSTVGISVDIIERMDEKDTLCLDCTKKIDVKYALEIYNSNQALLSPKDFQKLIQDKGNQYWVQEAIRLLKKESIDNSSTNSPIVNSNNSPISTTTVSSPSPSEPSQSPNLSNFTSAEQLRMMTKTLHDKTKSNWDKNGVVQYKDEALAILQRMWGQQVQFIVACAQLSKEGYRLMAIDEGKEGGQSSGGFVGGVNAYFYFQKMDYVR